ncbi:hypothetical protein J2S43_008037 [Catenuloplanes nepalensis]|uniref:Uncharacterized protein n=1 Tax=Catenuloplanes nepalensis TaxID=587533 RepID=A0ABT9N751_9ACTN|nr:hypothetical protein [Catenuloplanes nepalensis]MDP9799525.1 hypothetical protein [Catenuloplanes nepalensis]
MLERRWVAHALMAIVAGLLGAVTLGAAPAYADEVAVSAPSSFTAGDGPQNVDIRLRREDDGCIRARAQLRIRADDLSADQVVVAVNSGGQTVQVQLSAQGDGDYVTQLVQPAEAEMCERRNRQQTVRFRVAFGPNAPNGDVRFEGFMLDENDNRLADGDDEAQIRGGEAAPSPTPSRSPSKSPSPSSSPEEEKETEAAAAPTFESLPPDPAGPVSLKSDDSLFGGLGVPIAIGVVMVGVGVALIVLLVRRSRAEDEGGAFAGGPGAPGPRGGGGGGGGVYGAGPRGGAPRAGGWSGAAEGATQMLPAQPPPGVRPPVDLPTQRYPGVPSGPNANRARTTPPDPTTKLPRVTE